MRSEQGFTLLEMLLAMTILALVLMLATASLRFTGLAWNKGAASAERIATLGTVHDLLRRQAAAALRVGRENAGAPAISFFAGDASEARWLVAEPSYLGPPEQALVSFRVEVLGSGREQLRFAREPLADGSAGDDAGAQDLILLETGDRLIFDYFGLVGDDGAGRWLAPWPERRAPPRLIRLRKLDGRGEQTWPALIVRLPVEAEVGCLQASPPTPATTAPSNEVAEEGTSDAEVAAQEAVPPQSGETPPPSAGEGSAAAFCSLAKASS